MNLIDIRFSNKGEEGSIPINAHNLNLLIEKINEVLTATQYMIADANGTHFTEGLYVNGNELVAEDDYKDPSNSLTEETSTEEVS